MGCIVCEPREYVYKIKMKINDKGTNDNVARCTDRNVCTHDNGIWYVFFKFTMK